MSFDLYWANPPEPGTASSLSGDAGYFRLAAGSIADVYCAMLRFDMVDQAFYPIEEPEPADFGLPAVPDVYAEDGTVIEHPAGSPEERFRSAITYLYTGDRGSLIPAFKLGTNDGWLVTAGEIERSLALYDERLQGADPPSSHRFVDFWDETVELDWWGEWITWLRQAAIHGGFYVW